MVQDVEVGRAADAEAAGDPTDLSPQAVSAKGAHQPRKPLYPNYRPRGIHRDWDHCSMEIESTALALRRHHVPDSYGVPLEAVAWFDRADRLRVLVADFENGRRVIVRLRPNGTARTELSHSA